MHILSWQKETDGDPWIAGKIKDDIEEFGYSGALVRIKSDQEPAIVDVQRAVIAKRGSAPASLQELAPQRGGQTLHRVLLGSRVQHRTCQSGLQHIGAPTAAALIRAHSRTERRQPATSNCWLALHRLERGLSSVSFSQKQNAFWRREN